MTFIQKILYPYKNLLKDFISVFNKTMLIWFVLYSLFLLYITAVMDRVIGSGNIKTLNILLGFYGVLSIFKCALIVLFVSNISKIYKNTFSSSQLKLLQNEFEGNIKVSKTNFIVFSVFILLFGLSFSIIPNFGWIIILFPILFLRYIFVLPVFLIQNSAQARFQSFYMIYNNSYKSYKSILMVLVHIIIMMILYLLFCIAPQAIAAYFVITTKGALVTTGMMIALVEWLHTIIALIFATIYVRLSLMLYCYSRDKEDILLN